MTKSEHSDPQQPAYNLYITHHLVYLLQFLVPKLKKKIKDYHRKLTPGVVVSQRRVMYV
jgi:hypothetical protein